MNTPQTCHPPPALLSWQILFLLFFLGGYLLSGYRVLGTKNATIQLLLPWGDSGGQWGQLCYSSSNSTRAKHSEGLRKGQREELYGSFLVPPKGGTVLCSQRSGEANIPTNLGLQDKCPPHLLQRWTAMNLRECSRGDSWVSHQPPPA